MTTELDPRLVICWLIVERNRNSYSPSFREFLDKIFLKRFAKCKRSTFEIQNLKVDLKKLAQAVDEIRYTRPGHLPEAVDEIESIHPAYLSISSDLADTDGRKDLLKK
jgi:hypothetical protein